MTDRIRRALTIAGSDSGGGAGIQADLKAFAACGVHGMTAITAITAQSTVGVDAIESVSPAMIRAQVRAVARDIGVDAVKVGMLGTAETIVAVAGALDELGEILPTRPPVVLDPVMVSESGARLLERDARRALVEELLPRVTVATPNLPEARVLAGATADEDGALADEAHPRADDALSDGEDVLALARAVRALGPAVVIITGGHRATAADLYHDGMRTEEIEGERHPAGAAHGSGCTHSSVLAARLALGDDPLEAARVARRRAGEAVRDGLRSVGAGAGPVDILGIARILAAGAAGGDRARAAVTADPRTGSADPPS
ncbi:MAG TPA: bifunctional hydroxymethylpyrimidine kinase/phosphomethylpyrimidine kinase [Solirubrobacteraceae bacterium]|nr:bifunctional hydroxymethylpyrimidine kinase/phosphomethylpyrimidine kinase [Solirubrobacteraceae bacterium]